ncbi:unnamed protein product [Protopolystoma xenopodis]|uniref:Uncharacterized protein n=1 Tax=Protopolystoma xenopodis TaxID=117903 RepID=A0A448XR41_9PLAT|nr:unnamed protein product [Protopolystoma xenopodis]
MGRLKGTEKKEGRGGQRGSRVVCNQSSQGCIQLVGVRRLAHGRVRYEFMSCLLEFYGATEANLQQMDKQRQDLTRPIGLHKRRQEPRGRLISQL